MGDQFYGFFMLHLSYGGILMTPINITNPLRQEAIQFIHTCYDEIGLSMECNFAGRRVRRCRSRTAGCNRPVRLKKMRWRHSPLDNLPICRSVRCSCLYLQRMDFSFYHTLFPLEVHCSDSDDLFLYSSVREMICCKI